ncbi:NAD(P)/FAD-dependent oxidoreductase [Parapedomonas caeni]
MERFDIVVIGAGIGGASAAAFLAARARVLVLEAEALPGYHTSGRSAAFYAETYGGPRVQPLTTASRAFLEMPPAGFADTPLLRPRGALHLARPTRRHALLEERDRFPGVTLTLLDADAVAARLPMMHPDWLDGALWEPDCRDIDTAALLQGYLAMVRRTGGEVLTDARVTALAREAAGWTVTAGDRRFQAPVVVNAAGAWADEVAVLAGIAPIGFTPLRRTMISFKVPEAQFLPDLPVVLDIDGSFYFKPDAGTIWASPHDEIPSVPCDAQPDELDIAITVDRIEAATTFRVRRIERSWAGLRTFSPDRVPVYGFEPAAPGFFWCSGQGGFGFQTAPAAGELVAALVHGSPLPEALQAAGVQPALYAPGRFAR